MANTGRQQGAVTITDAPTSRTNLGLGTMATVTTPIPTANGGSGVTSFTANAVIVSNGSGQFTTIGPATDGQVIMGAATGPLWGTITSSDGSINLTTGANTLAMNGVQATTSQSGGAITASDAEAVTGTDTAKAITPASFRARMAAPGAIGGTTPSTGTFTSVRITSTTGPTITTASGAPGVSAPLGSIYFRTNGSSTTTRAYVNTDGGSTWTALKTVA